MPYKRASLGLNTRLTAANLRVFFAFPCDAIVCEYETEPNYLTYHFLTQ